MPPPPRCEPGRRPNPRVASPEGQAFRRCGKDAGGAAKRRSAITLSLFAQFRATEDIHSDPIRSNPLRSDPALSAHEGPAGAESSTESPGLSLPLDLKALERLILTRLDDDKAQDIVHIDLADKSSVADSLIVASGRSHRHVGALADHLLRALKENGYGKARVEGLPHCDWVLIDAGDVVIHLFRPEVRSFYNIEKIWAVDAPHRTAAN